MDEWKSNSLRKHFSQPRFDELDQATVERSKDVVYIIDSKQRIIYCNPAWDEFALANGGEEAVAARVLGTDLMHYILGPLRCFYVDVFENCRKHHLTFALDYECSSAKLYRLRHLNILPLKHSGELAFVSSERVEHNHAAERPAQSPAVYLNAHGMVAMCCHCRRTRRQDRSEVWDWVPAFLETKIWDVTHGMCPICVSYFYSEYLKAGRGSGAA